jgi:DNA polymerase-3 subunit epsilon
MKLFFVDLETTGTKYWRNGVHQISGCVEIDGEVKEYFDFHVKPNPKAEIDEVALDISGVTRQDLEDYADMGDVYNELITILSRYIDKYNRKDKFFLVGFNAAAFDGPFFRAFFKQNGDEYYGSWFYSVPLDVIVLAMEYLKDLRAGMNDFKLHTVAEALLIEVDQTRLHDAKYDIDLTREIYHRLSKVFSSSYRRLQGS